MMIPAGIPRAIALAIVVALPATASAQSLDAADPTEIERAITACAQEGDRAAAQRLAARIDRGLPAPLLSRALDALVQNGSAPATEALRTLAHHRRSVVRVQIARGLARRSGASARDVLADLLDDPEADVRSAAAVALGEVGAAGVMDTVMLATIRGVPEAGILFAQQASAGDVGRFVRRLDAAMLEPTAPAVRVLLARANLPRPTRLAIVARLRELGGALSIGILREVGATLPEADPVRRAIDETIAAHDGEAAQ